jgi:peptide/nickel transport system substrate-binding protein
VRPAPQGTITIATTDFGVEATDPTLFESTWSWYYCDSLIAFDDQGNYIGEVAEDWNLSEDGKTWTFYIREGMKFHNGDPVTAHDVHFTMERFCSNESKNPWSNQLRDEIVSHRVIDDYTYEYITKTPQPQLVDTFCWVRIMSKTYFDEVGEEQWRAHPIGSGPWKFVEHVPEISFKVEANTEYWRPEHVPYFQYLVDLQVPEEATQVAMLKRGEIDIPMGLTTDRRVELEEEGYETRLQGLPPATVLAIIGSHLEGAGAVHDIRIRKALSYAINRQELCDTFWRGEATPGGRFFLAPGGYGVTDDLIEPDPYDPDLAKSLMAEAGYPDAFEKPVIVAFTTAGPGVDMWQAIMGYWDKVGFQTELKIVDMAIFLQYVFLQALQGDEEFLGYIWSWAGSAFNGTAYCRNMNTSYGIHQVTVNDEVTALFDKFVTELDPDLAVQYYTDWQRATKELWTTFGIAYVLPKLIVSDKIGEFTVNPHMFFNDAACGVKHPGQ